jgi:hypothetical protein
VRVSPMSNGDNWNNWRNRPPVAAVSPSGSSG